MTKTQKTKWLKALRSGKYAQGKNFLEDKYTNTYCCLGVARKVCGIKKRPKEELISSKFLKINIQKHLINMNDGYKKFSFNQIAYYIEKKCEM